MKTKRNRKLWAFLMAFAMILSLVLPSGMSSMVKAAVVDEYAIAINFFEFDRVTPKTPNISREGDNSYHVVALMKDKSTGEIAGYGFSEEVYDFNAPTTNVSITMFWTTKENKEPWGAVYPAWEHLGGREYGYDTDK